MHRIRTTLTPIGIALTMLGCTSGSEAVPIPGADAVVTDPLASGDLPVVTDPPATDAPPAEQPATTVASSQEATTSSTTAPVATQAPSSSTQAPASSTTAPAPPATTAAPPATDAPSEDVFLRIGDEGPEVGVMQLKLSVLGYLPAGSDTGVFDEATRGGLRSFQSDYGLGVDGIFGPLTGRALNAAVQSVAVET